MGVYIKGMEMPKSCAFCKLKRRNGKKMVCPLLNEEWDIRDPMSADFRLDNCPLVPVPDHGRLIDADSFIKSVKSIEAEPDYQHDGEDWRVGLIIAESLAYEQPTIIPAEEDET